MPSMQEVSGLIPRAARDRQGGVHMCTPSTWKGKTGGSEVQGHPGLHSEFEASLSYLRPALKTNSLSKGMNEGRKKGRREL